MLSYCLTCRLNFAVGGKIGLDADSKQPVDTTIQLAYLNGNLTDEVSTDSSDTRFATLGKLDSGLGYRIGCAWTIR